MEVLGSEVQGFRGSRFRGSRFRGSGFAGLGIIKGVIGLLYRTNLLMFAGWGATLNLER
ncbi:hypothetical protein D1AOALGA4SA_10872 [Olavius algarvensis Delta 1 endosymbiont]|nr:hypothetical protein D1AOALGA4SA_10872 [Olavius algarvensis Delta 1 endosymbiont]